MLGRRYVVVRGDNLWSIAERELGGGSQWPRIWRYNNRRDVKRITRHGIPNPDVIHIGQVLLIPEIPGAVRRSTKQDSVVPKDLMPAQPPTGMPPFPRPRPPQLPTGNLPPPPSPQPAQPPTNTPPSPSPQPLREPGPLERELPRIESPISLKYRLDDITFPPVDTPTAVIEYKITGDIVLMSQKKYPATYVTNRREIEAQVTQEANHQFGTLIGDNRFIYDPNKGTVTFRSMLVSQAKAGEMHDSSWRIGNAAATAVGVYMSSNSPIPKLRAEFRFRWLQGTVGSFVYTASEVKLVIEITPKPQPPAGPSPQPVRVPERGTNWGRVIGIGLVVTAGVIVVATIVEDFYTLGAGTADDPASFSAPSALLARGLAMVRAAALPTASVPAAVTIGVGVELGP